MRRIHTILAIIYWVICASLYILMCKHLNYITLYSPAWLLFWEVTCFLPIVRILIDYLLKRLSKDSIVLTGWHSVILPTICGVILGAIIELILMNSKFYDTNSRHIQITYLSIAGLHAALLPSCWHTAVQKKIKRTTEISSETSSGVEMNRNTKLIIMVFVIGLLGFAFMIFGFVISISRHTKGIPSLEKLESLSGIMFPQGTRLLNGYFEGFRDPQYIAVLEFDAKDTEAFIKSIPREKNEYGQTHISRTDRLPITDGWPTINRDKSHSWWDPDSVHKFVTVKILGWSSVYILISLDDVARTRVYLYIFTS